MTDYKKLIQDAENIIVLAGAGLTSELGIPVYWTGDEAKYGEEKSVFGYTALEHAHADVWSWDPDSQAEYFKTLFQQMSSLKFEGSVYDRLKHLVAGKNSFMVTSNVDSAFVNAGFDEDRLLEVHGAYRRSQCLIDGTHGIFSTPVGELAFCPKCGMIARPNVLFFNDFYFRPDFLFRQMNSFDLWFEDVILSKNGANKTVILEFGVGTTVPRIRQMGNRLYNELETSPYIHINLEPRPEFLFSDDRDVKAPEIWVEGTVSDFFDSL